MTDTQLPTWWDTVKGVMDQAGVPIHVWLPILIQESRGDPRSQNAQGQPSYGLFELYTQDAAGNRGQGYGYTPEQLYDPLTNARIAAPYLAAGIKACGGSTDVACVAARSGHPVNNGDTSVPGIDPIRRLALLINQTSNGTPEGDWAAVPPGRVSAAAYGEHPPGPGDIPGNIGSAVQQGVQAGISAAAPTIASAFLDQLVPLPLRQFLGWQGAVLLVLGGLLIVLGLLGIALRGVGAVAGGASNVEGAAGVVGGVAGLVGAAPVAVGAAGVARGARQVQGRQPRPRPVAKLAARQRPAA